MPFSQSRRTRSLRLFKNMNKKSSPQPVARKPAKNYRYDDESVGTFDMDLSMCSSTHSRGMDDSSWGLNGSSHSRSSHSRRCSFQPIDAAAFEWELDLDDEDDGFLDLSIRSVRGSKTKRSSANNKSENKSDKTSIMNEKVKFFFEDRVNIFTNNLEFLARKMTLC